jgi:hypothetical protein
MNKMKLLKNMDIILKIIMAPYINFKKILALVFNVIMRSYGFRVSTNYLKLIE